MHEPCSHPGCPGPVGLDGQLTLAVAELKRALKAHGITLPSLGTDIASYASATYHNRPGLLELGRCSVSTAQALAAVLRKAAEG